jgi:hypothetical protein
LPVRLQSSRVNQWTGKREDGKADENGLPGCSVPDEDVADTRRGKRENREEQCVAHELEPMGTPSVAYNRDHV